MPDLAFKRGACTSHHRHRGRRRLAAGAVMLGLAAPSMASATDVVEQPDPIETVEHVVPDVAAESKDSAAAEFDLADTIDIGGATLRLDVADQPAHNHERGMTAFANTHTASDFVVQQSDHGERMMHIIHSSAAPTEFEYDLDLEAGHTASLHGGRVIVSDAAGAPVGMVDVPWAYDSSGDEVPTEYHLVDGNLVLEVAHDASVDYPVVADPWVPAWIIYRCGAGFLIGWGSNAWHNVSFWTLLRHGLWGCIGGLLTRFY